MRQIWPAPHLPDIVEQWMTKYEPDIVMLHANGYWYSYPSVPLKLRRQFGRPGRAIASLGIRASETPWIATTRGYHAARHLALRAIGGAFYFTPDEVVETIEACARRIVKHEQIVLIVRGDLTGFVDAPHHLTVEVHDRLARICKELHVPFLARDWTQPAPARELYTTGDRLHSDEAVHRYHGDMEGAALAKAWLERSGVDKAAGD